MKRILLQMPNCIYLNITSIVYNKVHSNVRESVENSLDSILYINDDLYLYLSTKNIDSGKILPSQKPRYS